MIPLEVPVQQQKMTERKIGRYCSCCLYEKRFIRPNMLGEMMKGLSIRRKCYLPLFTCFGKNSLYLFGNFQDDSDPFLFGTQPIVHFVNQRGKEVNSDWLTDQWDERSVLGHVQCHKGRMKSDGPEIDTAHFNALLLFTLLAQLRMARSKLEK